MSIKNVPFFEYPRLWLDDREDFLQIIDDISSTGGFILQQAVSDFEAELAKYNLYISNEDKPGFISNLSKILSDNNINIATFNLGRKDSGGEAIALISTDNPIEEKVLDSIKKLPLVIQAKTLTFNE